MTLSRWLIALTITAGVVTPASAQTTGPTIDPQVTQAVEDTGTATFWVVLDETADLSGAYRIDDWARRGQYVVDQLHQHAERTQEPVRAALTGSGAIVEDFWAANALLVTGGSSALTAITARDDIREVVPKQAIALPDEPITASSDPVEWNVADIRAPQAWDEYGARGQGVTVGVIDTGADGTHPALAGSYRGNTGAGVDHGYNWFDPTGLCQPGAGPCDNVGHGTHVTGTIAGDGGPGNRIGVAPGARWIAAKGCAVTDCPDDVLLKAMQWMLAPTDATGANPRADLRPQVINNSWGSNSGTRAVYRRLVQAWAAAGILPVFASGNSGPGCSSVNAPGSYPEAYAVGAYDSTGTIAQFSSRGTSPVDDSTKPDISAPGVAVRSARPGGGYGLANGTSMATPHVTGSVALVLSAAPGLTGQLGDLRDVLGGSARDADDPTCGGPPGNNNTYGEGRLDAYAAVAAAPHGPTGVLAGTVTAQGVPVAGARVVATTGTQVRVTRTDAAGRFRAVVAAGTVTLRVTAFGYLDARTDVDLEGSAATAVELTHAPTHTVRGTVANPDGTPSTGVRVGIPHSPLTPVLSGENGAFTLPGVPAGTHVLTAFGSPCASAADTELTVDGDEDVTLTVTPARDARGHGCRLAAPRQYAAGTVLPITGDVASYNLTLPFAFWLYGKATQQIRISVDGRIATDTRFLSEDITGATATGPIPDRRGPAATLYPYWTDLRIDANASVRTGVVGTAPDRAVVVEWRDALLDGTGQRVTVQAILGEDGSVRFQYAGLDTAVERGIGAGAPVLTGIEDETSTTASMFTYAAPVLSNDYAVVYRGPAAGVLLGSVTDAVDGKVIDTGRRPSLTVRTAAGTAVTTVTPDAQGGFGFAVPPGDYTVTAAATNYVPRTVPVTLAVGRPVTGTALRLDTGHPVYGTSSLRFVGGQTQDLVVTNNGTAPLSVAPLLDSAWLSLPANTTLTLAPGAQGRIPVRANVTGLAPGVHTGQLRLTSNGGRAAESGRTVPVTLVVPAYATAVDAGGPGTADTVADRPFATNPGYGFTAGTTVSTTSPIGGTEADALYQTARTGDHAYRFTGLPAGVYEVRLDLAEIEGVKAGDRRFDVGVNGTRTWVGLDVAAIAGQKTALVRTVTVTVGGGELRVDLTRNGGRKPPLLNGITVTHRPDLAVAATQSTSQYRESL